jgi:hypothetical protein
MLRGEMCDGNGGYGGRGAGEVGWFWCRATSVGLLRIGTVVERGGFGQRFASVYRPSKDRLDY